MNVKQENVHKSVIQHLCLLHVGQETIQNTSTQNQ